MKEKNSIRKPHGKVTMLVQIPIALEELRQMMRVGAASHCEQCQAALSIVESIIATISGERGSLADGLRISDGFTCHGCQARIAVNEDDPERRRFIWNEKSGKENAYCYECDGKLIDGVPLPLSPQP